MKKSILAASVVLILTLSLCGCGEDSQHKAYKEIYKRYSAMDSFYAAATITIRSDKTESSYSVRQFYKSPDSFALFIDSPETVAGSGYTSKNGKFLLKSGFGNEKEYSISSPAEKNLFFLCDFFEEYYKSEETYTEVSKTLTGNSTVLSSFLTNGTKTHFIQSVQIDNKTYLPLTLETYDINKKPVITIKYNDFKRNCDIDERIFN